MTMDINRLRTLVFEKSGIKVDTSDPIFALVALNEAVLSECVEPHVAVLNDAADRLNARTVQLLDASEKYRALLQRLGEVSDTGNASPLAQALANDQRDAAEPRSVFGPGWTRWNWLAGAAGIALLSALLTVGAQWVIAPKKAPVQAVQASAMPPFTPEQVRLMQNGEKYNKMWTKLDPKAQARIETLLQQP
jgi:hypothetical protein